MEIGSISFPSVFTRITLLLCVFSCTDSVSDRIHPNEIWLVRLQFHNCFPMYSSTISILNGFWPSSITNIISFCRLLFRTHKMQSCLSPILYIMSIVSLYNTKRMQSFCLQIQTKFVPLIPNVLILFSISNESLKSLSFPCPSTSPIIC